MTIGEEDAEHFRAEFTAAGYGFERRAALQWATVPVAGKGAWQGYAGPLRTLTRELQSTGLLRGAASTFPPPTCGRRRSSAWRCCKACSTPTGTSSGAESSSSASPTWPCSRQARELVCSLGHKPGPIRERSIRLPDGRMTTAWRFGWTPLDQVFRLRRKAGRYEGARSRRTSGRIMRRAIVSIRPVPSVPVRCITVDSPDHLYLAGESMIPTHNTSFALGIAAHAALEARTPVLVFSLEMSHRELTQRLLCSEARVDATRMRNGKLLESDWPKISHAVGRLGEAPIFIDDNPHLTIMEIRAKARRLKSREGLGLIVIDYMQLMSGRSNAENRQVEVSEMSRGLKILARELNVPVIALSQLSRNLESRADKRPVLADLRESGSLEQDADVVMFLYRDEVYNRDTPDRGTAEVIVAKHRNGPIGVTHLAFLDHYTRFANMARGVDHSPWAVATWPIPCGLATTGDRHDTREMSAGGGVCGDPSAGHLRRARPGLLLQPRTSRCNCPPATAPLSECSSTRAFFPAPSNFLILSCGSSTTSWSSGR